jgi:enterochelin esterase-like enzyme
VELAPLGSVVYRVGDAAFQPVLDPDIYLEDTDNSGVVGTLITWPEVESAFLAEPRHVQVWLPPGYADQPDRRYRVIYMHDGQNVFDPRTASWGTDWGVDEAMLRGAEAGAFEPGIVVAAWSTPNRGIEYSPWHDANRYARFLLEELMPRVNAEFRTLTGAANTFVMGSSMGGLLSYYLVKNHPNAFGACGCVSSHFALSEASFAPDSRNGAASVDATPYILRDIESGDAVPDGVRFYFDYGTETLDASYEADHEPVREWLLRQGLVEGQDFRMRKYPGAAHSEAAWRARVGDQLEWLLNQTGGNPDF